MENIKREDIFYKYRVYYKFNNINGNIKIEILIGPYKDQYHENMIRNRMCDILFLRECFNQEKKSKYV